MRKFKKMLFMGNGDHSAAKCYELIALLQYALTYLGGVQQGVPREHPAWKEIDDMAADIYCALTGREPSNE